VLGCAVAEELFARFPQLSEGKLTRLRASLVREETLAEMARELGLAAHLRLGERETIAGATASILADALEAVFGAVFKDGGYAAARAAVVRVLGAALDAIDPERILKDAKSQLQEWLGQQGKALPDYATIATSGPDHRRVFEVACRIPELGLETRGRGTSQQRAQQEAAKAMLEKLAQ